MGHDKQAELFKALAHPARLHILMLLRQGEVCVCHIEAALGRRQAYVSQQLMVLRDAGLVAGRKSGLQVYYRIADARVEAVLAAIYGPSAASHQPPVLEGCPCPACSALAATIIN